MLVIELMLWSRVSRDGEKTGSVGTDRIQSRLLTILIVSAAIVEEGAYVSAVP